jgi:hypothetical protein
MRALVLAIAATALMAQNSPEPSFYVNGQVAAVASDRIEVKDAAGTTHVLYSDTTSIIWRGTERHDFSALRVGDEVDARCRREPSQRAVVIHLWANIDKVEGRITHIGPAGFQVNENYSAPPESGYRRGLREIVYDSGTTWEDSLPEDLRTGRDVFVVGLKLPSGVVQATRVIVYEGRSPVRMKPSQILKPSGAGR